MATRNLLAIDIGAESGRAVLGRFDGSRIQLQEIHRFPNGPVRMLDTLYWDLPRLWGETLTGLTKAVKEAGPPASVGVDTWGVDFGFLDQGGRLAGLPVCYRDARTEGILDHAFARVPKAEIYDRTGLQFLRFNSLYQLVAMGRETRFDPFEGKAKLLFVPDLLNYLLSGVAKAEYTIASTSQMLDARRQTWDVDLVGKFGLPTRLLPELARTGEMFGPLLAGVVAETGATGTRCVASAGHDTGAAVAAVPAEGDDWAFISSGTWSLMGAELAAPAITPQTLADNFTNEGGVGGTIRFLKNIMGLWLVQQCKRSFDRQDVGGDYTTLTALAAEAPAFGPIVDPDRDDFLNPPDMPEALRAFCKRTGQSVPSTVGQVVRCCLESLALKYRFTLEQMERSLGRRFGTIHVVGGGCRNALLCQMTADCCQRRVVAGPIEATAIGNCLIQAIGTGELGSLADLREVVRRSFEPTGFTPGSSGRWDEMYAKFKSLVAA